MKQPIIWGQGVMFIVTLLALAWFVNEPSLETSIALGTALTGVLVLSKR